MIEFVIAGAIALVVGLVVLAHRPSDAELHHAAEQERRRRAVARMRAREEGR